MSNVRDVERYSLNKEGVKTVNKTLLTTSVIFVACMKIIQKSMTFSTVKNAMDVYVEVVTTLITVIYVNVVYQNGQKINTNVENCTSKTTAHYALIRFKILPNK